MTDAEVLSLLDLLEARGVVAWVAVPDAVAVQPVVALLCEADGFESATALLVSRGFRVHEEALPGRLCLGHASFGLVELQPARFDAAGNAVRHLADGRTLTIPVQSLVVDEYGPGRARQVRA